MKGAEASLSIEPASPADDLAARCRARDPRALQQVAEKYGPRVYRCACAWTGDPDEAQDLAQETIVRFLETVDHFEGSCSLATWLFRIAHNLLANRRRRQDVEERSLRRRRPSSTTTPDADRALDLIAAVPEELRQTLTLFYVEGLSLAEIGEVLDLPLSTLKWRLFDGRKRIRLLLEKTS